MEEKGERGEKTENGEKGDMDEKGERVPVLHCTSLHPPAPHTLHSFHTLGFYITHTPQFPHPGVLHHTHSTVSTPWGFTPHTLHSFHTLGFYTPALQAASIGD
jgi:hypothetical protein